MALVSFYVNLYMFYVVPEFKNASSGEKFMIRLLVHPCVVVTGEMLLRHVASQPSDVPIVIRCMNMINFDQFFQLVGRFLVASQEGDLANVMVVVVAVQE